MAKRIARLRSDVEQARKRLADAALLLIDGTLDRAGYDAARIKIEVYARAAQDEIERLEAENRAPTLPDLDTVLASVGGWASLLVQGDIEAQRRVLAEVIERLTPVKVRHGHWRAEITWTTTGDALRQLAGTARSAA